MQILNSIASLNTSLLPTLLENRLSSLRVRLNKTSLLSYKAKKNQKNVEAKWGGNSEMLQLKSCSNS